MEGYFDVQSNAKVHDGPVVLDENVRKHLPAGSKVLSSRGHGVSNWNKLVRIDAETNGSPASYFLKISDGTKGLGMIEGEYESMLLIYKTVPAFAPQPLAWGTCTDTDRHFLLFSFYELQKGLPSIDRLTHAVAQLHTVSAKAAPYLEDKRKRFGFHITTYNGTLAQDNTWTETWEEFYSRGMKRILQLEKEARGLSEELEAISGPFLETVIPRLLRPLETDGRSIEPVLIHGDLWIGNLSTRKDTGEPIMFDASAFWGHNEYELSTMRPLDNDWGRECMASYHRRIPKSEPREDWDARNALYATRTYIHDSALYPDDPRCRQKLIDEMRKLVDEFGSGDAEMSE
ncbi:Fructosamine kinase-domain-containing protein [Achaetomium macrosporum]|uniref:protein-ribulosamine 3-kinase n=1 Tax=Achaetomium macrosporum TaxID=79813 RepID=A0AAN7CKD7_9PEZI|nr:Fructosamine kinase-domain-containing protein [Achaetomium macrosporum]